MFIGMSDVYVHAPLPCKDYSEYHFPPTPPPSKEYLPLSLLTLSHILWC